MQGKSGATLYLFDEPSTGLHYVDILKLLEVFQSLVDAGDTVVFIEHNAVMVDAADAVVELGPGSGVLGGEVCLIWNHGLQVRASRDNLFLGSLNVNY